MPWIALGTFVVINNDEVITCKLFLRPPTPFNAPMGVVQGA